MVRSAKRALSVSLGAASSNKRPRTVSLVSAGPSDHDRLLKMARDINMLKKTKEVRTLSGSTTLTPTITPQALATGPLVWSIRQGVTGDDRSGDKAMVTEMKWHMTLTMLASAASPIGATVWLYVVQDKNCDGAALIPLNVWHGTSGLATNTRNPEYLARYNILAKRKVTFSPGDIGVNFADTKSVEIGFRKRILATYDANSGVAGDLTLNNVQLVYYTDQATTQVSGPCVGTISFEDVS